MFEKPFDNKITINHTYHEKINQIIHIYITNLKKHIEQEK